MDGIKKREFILPRLFEFVKKYNITLIIVSHDVRFRINNWLFCMHIVDIVFVILLFYSDVHSVYRFHCVVLFLLATIGMSISR